MVKKFLFLLLTSTISYSVFSQNLPQNTIAKIDSIAQVKYIGIYVTPYYQSATTPEGRPTVSVSKNLDSYLSSNKSEDILAVRDTILSHPQSTTPMTLMVLAIRLYDVGLRDDAVFWFYVAKNRFFTMDGVLDVKSSALAQIEDSVKNFAVLAGPFINSYAFCDPSKQRDASVKAIDWVEKNPYEVLFVDQAPALPGDRMENLKNAIANIKSRDMKDAQYFNDPKNLAEFNRKRIEKHVPEQFCWASK